jgi:hypothetical protein
MNILDLVDKCKQLGQDEPNLDKSTLSKRLAKMITRNHIMDEDAFELGEKAYEKGKKTVNVVF